MKRNYSKIMVTGGAGFIGSEFVRQAVKRGYKIIVVDKLAYAGDLERLKEVKDKYTFYRADISDIEMMDLIFSKESPEVVINFAAQTHVDKSIINAAPFIESNIKGTQVLLELVRKYKTERFIQISTDEVYGDIKEGKFAEDFPLLPNSPYAASKAGADMLIRAYYRTYKLPVIIVRPCNNYGWWQYPEKLIPLTISKIIKNEKIPVYGKGVNVREWIYVSDCIEAILIILERGKIGEIYNVGSGEERRNKDVVQEILNILGASTNLIEFVKDRPGHDFRYALAADKILTHLGWFPKIKFEEGLRITVKWYIEHKEWVLNKFDQLSNNLIYEKV